MIRESATNCERFEKRVEFRAAFDKRHDESGKNYGIHGVGLTFILKGKLGAVVGTIFTGWHLPEVQAELEHRPESATDCRLYKPIGATVYYHGPKPNHDGDEPVDDCQYIGGPCYSDVSFMNGEDLLEALIRGGDKGVWDYMEGQYRTHLDRTEEIEQPEKPVKQG